MQISLYCYHETFLGSDDDNGGDGDGSNEDGNEDEDEDGDGERTLSPIYRLSSLPSSGMAAGLGPLRP